MAQDTLTIKQKMMACHALVLRLAASYVWGQRNDAVETTTIPIISSDTKIEEERFPDYEASDYYPVRLGDLLNSRYFILGKLGYGRYSTVWLARDILHEYVATQEELSDSATEFDRPKQFVALKICLRTPTDKDLETSEHLRVLKRLRDGDAEHVGRPFVNTISDYFQLIRHDGIHLCLVQRPLREHLIEFRNRGPSDKFPEAIITYIVHHLLLALDYLHTECSVIHTDIKSDNILIDVEDESIFEEFEKEESTDSSPRKIYDDRVIYTSRAFGRMKRVGLPILCDFGQAVFGDVEHNEDVQPELYRAPEVILEAKWSYSVDIWNVGVLIWDLFENRHLFNAKDPENGRYTSRAHLAEMIALMGPPPLSFLQRGKRTHKFFDDTGKWCDEVEIPSALTFESSVDGIEGEKKKLFLKFIRKMLKWVPEERQTAKELLEDPWLKGRGTLG